MKTFALILLVASFALAEKTQSEEERNKLAEIRKDCIKSSGVPVGEVDNAKKGVFADDQKLKEFLFCAAKKVDYMDKDGHYRIDVIQNKITANHGEQISKEVVGPCTAKIANNGPDTSLILAKCLFEKSKQHVSLV